MKNKHIEILADAIAFGLVILLFVVIGYFCGIGFNLATLLFV